MPKKQPPIKIVVLDVLKPHKPDIVEFGQTICADKTVASANITVYAMDEKTESLKIILEGTNINFEAVKTLIEEHGAVIHSVDKVVVGKKEIIPVPPMPVEATQM